MPVQGNVGGVEVEDDLPGRRLAVRLEEEADERRLDRGRVVADAMVAAGRAGGRVFEPVQRALAGQRRAVAAPGRAGPGRKLAGEHRQHRIVAEVTVIDHVLMPERYAEDALADQRGNLVLDTPRHSAIAKAGSEPPDQVDRAVRRAEQQRAGIRGDRAAVEGRHHAAALDGGKIEQRRATLRLHRGSLLRRGKSSSQRTFADSGPRCTYAW